MKTLLANLLTMSSSCGSGAEVDASVLPNVRDCEGRLGENGRGTARASPDTLASLRRRIAIAQRWFAWGSTADPGSCADDLPARNRAISWAELLRRVFAIDVLKCEKCDGDITLIAIIPASEAVKAIFDTGGIDCPGQPRHRPA